ncbi:hypothetical protein [Novosphingobium malaysiense]|uniref:Uncharacterized protein n=1 Tax=Novosphingobium malaysiense TaxID=1348853 RepID=A0A0B1ZIS4_9SPHN|nr:hypothetical protein [Novosphingobium malaysiense]KHK91005.1 hypothetical protein LK12_08695 [Novosphingobium malaysiense]
MADETKISEHPAEAPATVHTTVVREKSSSSVGILMAIVLLVAVIGAMYLFGMNSTSENAKNNAIAKAASDVGNAASKVGNAAQSAAEKVNSN